MAEFSGGEGHVGHFAYKFLSLSLYIYIYNVYIYIYIYICTHTYIYIYTSYVDIYRHKYKGHFAPIGHLARHLVDGAGVGVHVLEPAAQDAVAGAVPRAPEDERDPELLAADGASLFLLGGEPTKTHESQDDRKIQNQSFAPANGGPKGAFPCYVIV